VSPRKSKPGAAYPPDWLQIARRVKEEAGWRCVRCGREQSNEPGKFLTIHHLDLDPSNSAWWNLLCLCCPCHLSIQARVILERPWVLEHTTWFQPYVAAWYAKQYLRLDLSRDETMVRLDELLALERRALIGSEVPIG
jgi:hypothetical protein